MVASLKTKRGQADGQAARRQEEAKGKTSRSGWPRKLPPKIADRVTDKPKRLRVATGCAETTARR